MFSETFNPEKELQEIKDHRKMQRRKLFRRSKLEKFRTELVALRKLGASAQDLVSWLRMKHRLKIHRSTIDRFLSGLPEIQHQLSSTFVIVAKQPAADPPAAAEHQSEKCTIDRTLSAQNKSQY
jgi:hypothetical protein